MTQKQAKAELKYRLAKYVLQVLLDAGTITTEEMELARKKLCKNISHSSAVWRRGSNGRSIDSKLPKLASVSIAVRNPLFRKFPSKMLFNLMCYKSQASEK